MSNISIEVSDIHKKYDLGVINSGTLSHDLNKWWAKLRGKEDPTSIVDNEKKGKEYWALKGLSFEIQKGESIGIIGKNGAGKSTLLKILSRVTTPTRGTINISGRLASLLEVGTGFHPDLSGNDNIYMNGAILGMKRSEIKAKYDEIIDFSGIEKYINTPVKRYSSGMYMRLAFAVAAHLEPEILVVDEVLAVGDAEFQRKCLGKMKDINDTGRTVIFVSHDMASIRKFCNRTILLNQGLVEYDGETNEGIKRYLKQEKSIEKKGIKISATPLSPTQNWEAGTYIKIEISWQAGMYEPGWECDIAAYNMEGTKIFALQSNFFDDFRTDKPSKGISFFIKNLNFSENELRLDLGIRKRGSTYYHILIENCLKLHPTTANLPNYKRNDVICVPDAYCELIEVND